MTFLEHGGVLLQWYPFSPPHNSEGGEARFAVSSSQLSPISTNSRAGLGLHPSFPLHRLTWDIRILGEKLNRWLSQNGWIFGARRSSTPYPKGPLCLGISALLSEFWKWEFCRVQPTLLHPTHLKLRQKMRAMLGMWEASSNSIYSNWPGPFLASTTLDSCQGYLVQIGLKGLQAVDASHTFVTRSQKGAAD